MLIIDLEIRLSGITIFVPQHKKNCENVLAFFAKYRYDVSKVSIQGNTGLNNERQTQRSHDRNPVMASCFLSRSDEYGNFTETVM